MSIAFLCTPNSVGKRIKLFGYQLDGKRIKLFGYQLDSKFIKLFATNLMLQQCNVLF